MTKIINGLFLSSYRAKYKLFRKDLFQSDYIKLVVMILIQEYAISTLFYVSYITCDENTNIDIKN